MRRSWAKSKCQPIANRVVSAQVPPRTPHGGRPATQPQPTAPPIGSPVTEPGADVVTAADVIAPVVLPPPVTQGRAPRAPVPVVAREPLPLADLPPQRTSAVIYGASAVDDRGRVTDRAVLRALGWTAGHRLDIHETAGALTVVPADDGQHQVTGQGHLRIPAVLRRRCGLSTGDRVLMAADPDRSHLAIYPPAALDKALAPAPAGR